MGRDEMKCKTVRVVGISPAGLIGEKQGGCCGHPSPAAGRSATPRRMSRASQKQQHWRSAAPELPFCHVNDTPKAPAGVFPPYYSHKASRKSPALQKAPVAAGERRLTACCLLSRGRGGGARYYEIIGKPSSAVSNQASLLSNCFSGMKTHRSRHSAPSPNGRALLLGCCSEYFRLCARLPSGERPPAAAGCQLPR